MTIRSDRWIRRMAQEHGMTGEALLTAVTLGYEVSSRISRAAHMREIVHPHGTFGVLGAAIEHGDTDDQCQCHADVWDLRPGNWQRCFQSRDKPNLRTLQRFRQRDSWIDQCGGEDAVRSLGPEVT